MVNHRTFLAFAAAVIAAAVLAPGAAAILLPSWKPSGYRLTYGHPTATSSAQSFARGNNFIEYHASYRVRQHDSRCASRYSGLPVHRIKVPSWVRVYTVVGSPGPSLFRGRYVYWVNLGRSRTNDETGPWQQNYEAWACSAGRYRIYVNVTSSGSNAARPQQLARIIRSTVST
jgi:hypothetical protein